MKPTLISVFLAGLIFAVSVHGQVPTMISYQGRVMVNNNNVNGTGLFKFALVDGNGSVSFWSNDGSSVGGGEPGTAVSIPVDKGLYSVLLGDLPMTPIPHGAFNNPDVRLRVWFSNGQQGFQQFTPDQRIASVGYAMMAANVSDLAITTPMIADGAVTAAKLDPSVLSSVQVPDDLDLGAPGVNGSLDVYSTLLGTPAIRLDGAANNLTIRGDDGAPKVELSGNQLGTLRLRDSNGDLSARLSAGDNGAFLHLHDGSGQIQAALSAAGSGGVLVLTQVDGDIGLVVDGDSAGAGAVEVSQGDGSLGVRIDGDSGDGGRMGDGAGPGGGEIEVYRAAEAGLGVRIDGQGAGNSGEIELYNLYGQDTIRLRAHNTADFAAGPEISLHSGAVPDPGVLIGCSLGGYVELFALDSTTSVAVTGLDGRIRSRIMELIPAGGGAPTISMTASDGRVRTRILEITGGADLSEAFDINAGEQIPQPGMIVCIDPANPAELVLSSKAYDRTVAGVISGAGGVNPGMVMGQAGTLANGKFPVALTGRVYVHADTSGGAIAPGDLLTTSSTPGHAMKVTDPTRAQGAVLGKAMSALDEGMGLVLMLVALQ